MRGLGEKAHKSNFSYFEKYRLKLSKYMEPYGRERSSKSYFDALKLDFTNEFFTVHILRLSLVKITNISILSETVLVRLVLQAAYM